MPIQIHPGERYHEIVDDSGRVRPHYSSVADALESFDAKRLADCYGAAKRQAALDSFTFRLDPRQYRPTPADYIPRVIPAEHWATIEKGLSQRLRAINRFLADVYCGSQDIVPPEVIFSSRYYYPEQQGFMPPKGVFVHIYGADLVHLGDGRYSVLEDNVRIPSGITYQVKMRQLQSRFLPELTEGLQLRSFDIEEAYRRMFRSLCDDDDPVCALLTDGRYGAAFFEHRWLSDMVGLSLVEGSDLHISPDGEVRMLATDGDVPVKVIYRRVEDLELFSPGLSDAYRNGKVVLVNAYGTGVADDKLVFRWMPELIRHYLGEEPVLEQPETFDLLSAENRRFVLSNVGDLVVKSRQGYGGLGVHIMRDLGDHFRRQVTQHIIERPEEFVAQETLDFSQHSTFNADEKCVDTNYIDLRVFSVMDGDDRVTVFPGGLTRVAVQGSRITNNSSGGLCKSTWVLQS